MKTDVQGLEFAIRSMKDVIEEHIRLTLLNQKYAMIFCAIVPFGAYFGWNWFFKKKSELITTQIPSAEQLVALIRVELDKREATKRAVVSFTATQLAGIFALLALICLLYLVYKQSKKDKKDSNLESKYR